LAKIEPQLLKSFESRKFGKENVMVSMTDGDTTPILKGLNFPENATHEDRAAGVYQALTAHAVASQSSTLEFLASTPNTGFSFTSSWISNRIYVKGANRELVQSLASLPGVDSVEKTPEIRAIGSIKSEGFESRQGQRYWGIERVEAAKVWEQGITGAGVRVMIIDTGLNIGHRDLRPNYLGDENGWFDAVNGRKQAYDDQGHGSHCAGSVLGQNGMGVAPGAIMMGCKALSATGSGNGGDFDECAEFTIAPNGNTNFAAHVASNSWGGNQGSYFNAAIQAWREAGIIPVFAAGNDGQCDSIGYPGTHKDVITVGATEEDNSLAGFSSRGPGPAYEEGKNKPEISAPGDEINSASHRGNGYARMSGTSMACPHVAGMVALMLEKNPALKYDDILETIQENADQQNTRSAGETCGGRMWSFPRTPRKADNEWPNWHFGYGIISAPEAVNAV